MKLPFKGDVATKILTRRLRNAVSSTYYSANLRCVFSCSSLINTCTKDKLPLLTSSMVVYLFRCVCNALYVGRTARQLSTRIKEHHPKWLSQGRTGTISSAVLAHLVDSGHRIDLDKAFSVIHTVPPNRSKAVRLRSLAIAEALYIRRFKPNLCVQKRFVQSIHLPWPAAGQEMTFDPTGQTHISA